jgi:CRP/FNR family cyclic AMP-dependent transcriptional regulator
MAITEERLESQDVFGLMRPDQVNALSNVSETVRFKAGEDVYQQGQQADHIYVVLEGEVALRLPGRGGVTVPIDQATPGAVFGACMCFDSRTYSTKAQCTQDSKVMKIDAVALQKLMDEDHRIGSVIQRRMSGVYFKRYVETMRKLQSIVMNLPVEA